MAISTSFIEDLRLQMQTDLQVLLTHTVSVKEATVRQEFEDKDENYPCVILDITTGNSPSRHIGRAPYDLIHVDLYCLTLRPTLPAHIILCSDSKSRSGRDLVEYLAIKLNNYLKTYRPVSNIIDVGTDLVLNPDIPERDGVYKTIVQYEFII